MTDPGARQRTRITVPRVDFDLSALFVGMLGFFAYELVWRVLGFITPERVYDVRLPVGGRWAERELQDFEVLRQESFQGLRDFLNVPYIDPILKQFGWAPVRFAAPAVEGQPVAVFEPALPWWNFAVVAVAMLLLWSIISGALSRIHAVRIAKDKSLSWDDGFAFAFANLKAFVQAPLFVALAAALFVGLDAAAGAVIAVPWVGAVLQIVLQPLAMLAGLIVTIIVLGAVFGFPLLHAAIATERNGMLDAISRTYSYAFTRPVMYVAGGSLVLLVGGIIALLGAWFLESVALRGLLLGASYSEETVEAIRVGYVAAKTFGMPGDLSAFSGPASLSVWVSWICSGVWLLIVRGFVLSYIVGGMSDLYMLLRREVDGTPSSEVYLDDEPAIDLGEPIPGQPAGGDGEAADGDAEPDATAE